MSVSLSLQFAQTEEGVVCSAAGVDFAATLDAPREQLGRVHVDFDGDPALCRNLAAELVGVLNKGVVRPVFGNV